MEVLNLVVVLALCGYGSAVSPTDEITITGRTTGSESVIYKVYALTASYPYSSSIPTIDEFKQIDKVGMYPTFLENNQTNQIYCFGFYEESCSDLLPHSDSNAHYHQHSIAHTQKVKTIYLSVSSTGQFAGITLWYSDVYQSLEDVANSRGYTAGSSTTTVDVGNLVFVGVVYDDNKLKFLFSRNSVLSSDGYYFNNIYENIITKVQTNIGDLENFKERYAWNPMKDVAQKACEYVRNAYSSSYWGSLYMCMHSYMMQYIVTMGDNIDHLRNHKPRNLLNTSDYSTEAYTEQVDDAIAFRNVIDAVRVTQSQTVELASSLGNYFKTTANFDRNIGVQDSIFLKGELRRLETGTARLATDLSNRLRRLLKNAIILNGIQIIDLEVKLAIAVGENMNPLKHIFGGTDLSTIYDLASQIADAAASFARAVRLADHMKAYSNMSDNMSRNFRTNNINIAQLNNIVALQNDANDQQLKDFAANYISKYGAYTPQVTSQQIAELGGKLATIVDQACELFYEPNGLGTSATQIGLDDAQDCVQLPGMVESLMSYYDETFDFQFALIDAFTNIARGAIAESLADQFNTASTQSTIDIKIAGLGTAMLEVKLHEIVRKHCDWLEYRYGGRRIHECTTFFFDESIIDRILTKDEGDIVKNWVTKYVYIPTEKPEHADDRGYPWINLTQLITTGTSGFRLPFGSGYEEFMMDHNWLPGNYRGSNFVTETSYFVNLTEAYIPGLKCADTSDPDKSWIEMSMISGEPNRLFPEEDPPQFIMPSAEFHFQYNQYNSSQGCAASPQDMRKKINGQVTSEQVCVRSPGSYHGTGDKLIPSIYAPWTLILGKHRDCELVHPKDTLGANPMITFRVIIKEVRMTGIDECWPSGSRCSSSQTCSNNMLAYSCS